jgi:hypothetical protein
MTPLGPFNWRVRILRASPGSVTTSTFAHLYDDQGRARCNIAATTRTKPAPISAARCSVCADPDLRSQDMISKIDPEVRQNCEDEFDAEFHAASPEAQRGVVGYLNTFSGPWGLKASGEDAVLGIIRACWPGWEDARRGIDRMRADPRLGRVVDELDGDCGESNTVALVERTIASLHRVLDDGREAPEDTPMALDAEAWGES